MKKQALRKDFYREVRKTLNRFLSILLINALGVAFFAGVRASKPDMQLSADAFYDASNLMDIRVLGSLGMTQEDVKALTQVEGVKEVMPFYSVDVYGILSEEQLNLQVMSVPDRMNRIEVKEGRMPEAAEECLVDYQLLEEGKCQIGDEILLKAGDGNVLSDQLHRERFTIVGAGTTSLYLSLERGTSSIGSGTLDGFLVVQPENFALDCYTQLCVTVDGALEMTCYSDAYDDHVDKVVDRIEEIAGERCTVRYAQVQEEGQEKIADARRDVDEGEQKLLDAGKELEDGRKKLADAREELDAGKQEVADGEAELADARKEISEGWEELLKAQDKLILSTMELQKGEAEYGSGKEELEKGYAGLEQLKAQLALVQEEAVRAQLEAQIQGMEAGLGAAAAELSKVRAQLDAGWAQIGAGNKEADKAEQELQEAEAELAQGEEELADARKKLSDAEAEYADANEEFLEGEAEYEEERVENEGKIADAKEKIAEAEAELADLEEPQWYVLDRQYLQTYVEYGSNADRIGAIGEVFPVIFFLVAALVSLTTMTRMVEEERTQIGTLKALGYGKWAIASKYILYALFSSFLGSILGLFSGQKLFPWVIINAYKILYNNLPTILLPLNLEYSVTATLLAVTGTTLAAWAACYRELHEVSAQLMRPAAPKSGKRVFLEHVPFLWKRLSFSQKAAVRNLIRYKKRFFMTIFGIGGCMALLLVGFGLQDSIMHIGDTQYGDIFVYDGSLGLEKDAGEEAQEELLEKLTQDERMTGFLKVRSLSLDAEGSGAPRNATLLVPENAKELEAYIHLRDRTSGVSHELGMEGVILSEKLAKLLGVEAGDTITLREEETKTVEVRVAATTENYFLHYIYMDPELYEQLYGEAPEWNQLLFSDKIEGEAGEKELKEEYLTLEAVSEAVCLSATSERVADMLRSMDLIIYVLVVSAGLLAFVVLYNLNNININERKRELATLKVLGFQDREVLSYVNRENAMLTVLGALAGVFLGILLHRFVILTAEVDLMMFGRNIEAKSYLYSVLLTFLFSGVINGAMFFKLRAINMVESLKSVE